ncbi:MAG: NADP-dependent malic enzyme [bacterium ADurb.Bin374]|nr:MAG: NADP-dependent malic enzyme [bacterium ADurb.Bin374]
MKNPLAPKALRLHESEPAGKIEIVPSKPCADGNDLSLAYTPGVAAPCLAIRDDPEAAWRYTGRGNLVGVITNGTAVLGLGNIGALAGKPVMEGKALLFKRFAGIDAVDLELDTECPAAFCDAVSLLEPSFGGINLEDIKAPECFEIEERLRAGMGIPVFHDDQHGTAVVVAAALMNALHLTGRKPDEARVAISGAGAAGIAVARHLLRIGVRRSHLVLCDIHGIVYKGRREGMHRWLSSLASSRPAGTLGDALEGADVFIGVSAPRIVTPAMLRKMRPDPIIFALANPVPEIEYDAAREARPDAVIATGRSDLPNQVNNLLGFPFLFRGALDVRASTINDEMKLAASKALADLARRPVPAAVLKAYGLNRLTFGRGYLLPKPFDPRLLETVPPAVAAAAMESGVARAPIVDLDAYRRRLRSAARRLVARFAR